MNRLKLVKIPFKFIYLILLICLNLTQQACSMNNTEKYLSLEINSENINYYIKFNNIKVHNETSNAPVKQSVPVNQWALNGDNTLLVSVNYQSTDSDVRFNKSKNDKLVVSLVLTMIQDNKKSEHTISTFNLSPSAEKATKIASSSTENFRLDSANEFRKSDNGDIEIGKWIFKDIKKWTDFTQTTNIDLGMPEWAYLDADDLGNDQTLSDDDYYSLLNEVYKTLEDIWALMKKKDITAVLKLTEIRSKDFDAAYYMAPGSKQKEMENSLTSAFNHKDLYLDELVAKNRVDLNIEANGKIVRLDVQNIGTPLMYYSHKDEAFTRYYDFYFMKKDGKLIIVR